MAPKAPGNLQKMAVSPMWNSGMRTLQNDWIRTLEASALAALTPSASAFDEGDGVGLYTFSFF